MLSDLGRVEGLVGHAQGLGAEFPPGRLTNCLKSMGREMQRRRGDRDACDWCCGSSWCATYWWSLVRWRRSTFPAAIGTWRSCRLRWQSYTWWTCGRSVWERSSLHLSRIRLSGIAIRGGWCRSQSPVCCRDSFLLNYTKFLITS